MFISSESRARHAFLEQASGGVRATSQNEAVRISLGQEIASLATVDDPYNPSDALLPIWTQQDLRLTNLLVRS